LRLSFLSVFLFFSIAAFAQWPLNRDLSKPWAYSPRHAIYLVPNKNPKLFRIAEGAAFLAWINAGEKDEKKVADRIIRIQRDSIFLLDSRFRLHDFSKVAFSAFRVYEAKDSAVWNVIYPDDSVYKSRREFQCFIRALQYRVKKQHRDWMCAPFHHNYLKINFSLFANLTIAISWEHRFNRDYAIDVEAGYQFQGVPGSAGTPLDEKIFPFWKQYGVIANAGMKYYFDKKGYLEPVLIYKYLAMSQARTSYPNGQQDWLQDAYTNQYGIALRLGTMIRLGGMIVDGYFGLGVKVMLVHQLVYGFYDRYDERLIWYNQDHSPNVYDLVQYYPAVNLGIKLGFGF